jgi:hypothetical protein
MVAATRGGGAALAVFCAAYFCAPAAGRAQSTLDYLGPRELALGEAMRASASGAMATTLNPAGLGLNNQLAFEGSYGYMSRDATRLVAVSACDSTVPVPGCFYYRYFKNEPDLVGTSHRRRVHEFGISLARALHRAVILGTTTKWYDDNTDLPEQSDSSGLAFDAGTIVRLSQAIRVAAVGHNLLATDSAQYPRSLAAGLALQPLPALVLGVDGAWALEGVEEGDSNGRYGAGAEYFLQGGGSGHMGFPLRAGFVRDVGRDASYLTGGLGLVSAQFGIDLSVRKQLGDGDEIMWQAGLKIFGSAGGP